VLIGSDAVKTGLTLFGQSLPHPILLAPTAFHRLAHPEGEVATARGAGAAEATFVVSSFTTRRLADIARAAKGPLWFQFFDLRKDQEPFIRDAVQEAEALGCKALCVTVDAPTTGPRNRQERAFFKIPEEFETPYYPDRRTRKSAKGLPITGGFGWNDIERVLRMSKLPVLLKGILDPDDAERAIQAGVKGLIVSNHGGRCLDTVPASIEALPRITERVAGRVPLLVDGGIRRGTDVLKALAFGASAVLVGRPYLYALGVEGERGVERVVNILKSELEMAMILAGRTSLGKIDRSVIW
jgi:4-hydroxymandelate oxidase